MFSVSRQSIEPKLFRPCFLWRIGKVSDVIASEDAGLGILVKTLQGSQLIDHTGTISRTPMFYRSKSLNEWGKQGDVRRD